MREENIMMMVMIMREEKGVSENGKIPDGKSIPLSPTGRRDSVGKRRGKWYSFQEWFGGAGGKFPHLPVVTVCV